MAKKFFAGLLKAQEIICVVLMIVMCIVIFAATVARSLNLFVVSWAEELARYCMIWIVFMGIGVAAQKGEHFCVEALSLVLSKKALKVMRVVCAVLVTAFCLFAGWYSIDILVFQIQGGQITPSLNWPMWWIYLAMPIGLFLMAANYCWHTYEIVTEKEKETEEVLEV